MIEGLNQGQGWSSKVCIIVGKNVYDKIVKINDETTLDVVQKKWIIATKKNVV